MDREPWRPLLLLPSCLGGGDGGEIHCYFKACACPGAAVARILDLCRIQPSACTRPLKFTAGLRPECLKGSREKAETHLSPYSLPRGPLPGSLLAERDLQPRDNGSTIMPACLHCLYYFRVGHGALAMICVCSASISVLQECNIKQQVKKYHDWWRQKLQKKVNIFLLLLNKGPHIFTLY